MLTGVATRFISREILTMRTLVKAGPEVAEILKLYVHKTQHYIKLIYVYRLLRYARGCRDVYKTNHNIKIDIKFNIFST
jgi:hypothetical protein